MDMGHDFARRLKRVLRFCIQFFFYALDFGYYSLLIEENPAASFARDNDYRCDFCHSSVSLRVRSNCDMERTIIFFVLLVKHKQFFGNLFYRDCSVSIFLYTPSVYSLSYEGET